MKSTTERKPNREPLQALEQAIIEQLQKVIDPETGADVWRMRLVENSVVDDQGHVSYRFRPLTQLLNLDPQP
jgi:metal-sulfur cluster biosynthetic enzyme